MNGWLTQSTAQSSPRGPRAMMMDTLRLLALLLIGSLMVFKADGQCNSSGGDHQCNTSGKDAAVLPLGQAFNIFNGYGFLAFSIHVAPISSPVTQNDTSLFQMATHPVLVVKQFHGEVKRFPNKQLRFGQVERLARLHLCASVEDLSASFFHAFRADGLHRPWRAFTASWKKQFLPKIYGIPPAFLTDDYNFVLIRVEKPSVAGSINGSMILKQDLLDKLPSDFEDNLQPAVDFFMKFGTHLLTNYTAGDALYQVLVYNSSSFDNHVDFRRRIQKFRPLNASRTDWIELLSHPAPVHVGKLQLISGNRTLLSWLESRLSLSTLPATLPSSARILAAPVLFNHFYRQLQPRAILSMNLMSITRAVPANHGGRRGLHNVLLNMLRLWEYNM